MQYWTTNDQPVGEQFSYWREVLCQAFTPLAAERSGTSAQTGLTSWVRGDRLASVNCVEVSSRTQLIRHGASEIRRTNDEHVFVNLMLQGQCRVTQHGRSVVVRPGGYSLVDTTSEYDQEYVEDPNGGEWRVLSFRVPRTQLVPLLADSSAFTAVAHDGKLGGIDQVVVSTMLSIWENLGRLEQASSQAAEAALVAVLASTAGATRQPAEGEVEDLDAALRASINRHVALNLRDGRTDLSATRTAARFGISVRKLHKLYELTDRSYARTVLGLRLDACIRELTDPATNYSLTDIATRWGFCDLSHLNRAFRVNLGCLPSAYRQKGAAAAIAPTELENAPALPQPRVS
ncbi:helix-turn-helix domain-containing protein [Pseudonocardia xishanensis]|uniref:HTH araC/xylS-type domain-containing protein n=1 Tax=Pseudonocardia xishanensis TaxID=630995 RepID=A0ABP8RVN1_9PSEU